MKSCTGVGVQKIACKLLLHSTRVVSVVATSLDLSLFFLYSGALLHLLLHHSRITHFLVIGAYSSKFVDSALGIIQT